MNDCKLIAPPPATDAPQWQWAEDRLRRVVHRYGYQEIRLPLLESARLYRAAGAATADDQSAILRPDGTPGCIKAVIEERGLGRRGAQRLWYQGPMFRTEGGRTRQFHQFGVEAFGMNGPDIDAEIILLGRDLLSALGFGPSLTLELHAVGTWREQQGNGPQGLASRRHFTGLCRLLDQARLAYRVTEGSTNGHGFYSRTVFDWIGAFDGQPLTLCYGGRYDDLAARCSGRPLAAVGCALNVENLIASLDPAQPETQGGGTVIELYSAAGDGTACALLAQHLRRQLPAFTLRNRFGSLPERETAEEVEWRVIVHGNQQAEVWSRRRGDTQRVALARTADVIAGRLVVAKHDARP